MCKINWEERFFEVAKDHYIRHKNMELAFIEAQRFIDYYRQSLEEATEEIRKEEKPKVVKDEDFESIWLEYRRKGSKKKALEQWMKLTEDEKERAKDHIPHYVSTREVQYQKDLERYLRDKCFLNVVFKGGKTIFDGEQKEEQKNDKKVVIGGVVYK